MHCIPVVNFPSMSPVPFKKALWMIFSGTARPVGPQGAETGIELLFTSLDAAIASDKGPSCAGPHSVAGRVRLEVSGWDGNDPGEGMPVLQSPCTGKYRMANRFHEPAV